MEKDIDDIVWRVTGLNWYYCLVPSSIRCSRVGLVEGVEEVRESTEVKLLEEERMSGGITGNDGLESAEDGSLNVDPLLLLPSFASAIAKILDIGSVKLLRQLGTDKVWKSLFVIIQKDDIYRTI